MSLIHPFKNLQEVCHQYWPSGAFRNFGNIRVDSLGEEQMKGCILRTFEVSSVSYSMHAYMYADLCTGTCIRFM